MYIFRINKENLGLFKHRGEMYLRFFLRGKCERNSGLFVILFLIV